MYIEINSENMGTGYTLEDFKGQINKLNENSTFFLNSSLIPVIPSKII